MLSRVAAFDVDGIWLGIDLDDLSLALIGIKHTSKMIRGHIAASPVRNRCLVFDTHDGG